MKKTYKLFLFVLLLLFAVSFSVVCIAGRDSLCEHSYTSYISDENATYFSDGTKTAKCDKGCGESKTIKETNSKLKLSKPKIVVAEQTAGSVTLKWDKVEGATGYRVYYKTADGWKKLVRSTKKTTFTLDNLKSGYKVRLAIRAYKKHGKQIAWAEKSAIIYTSTKCDNIKKLTSTVTSSSVKLSWNSVHNADGYRVYRKTSEGWRVIDRYVKNTSVTIKSLKSGKNYIFAVRPYLKTDSRVFSDYKTVKISTKLKAPETEVEFLAKNKIRISFKSVDAAEGYQIYRKINNGKYELYKTYTKPASISISLKPDKYYTFAVRAYMKSGGKVLNGEYTPVKLHCGNFADRIVVNPSQKNWSLVLVNKQRELPEGFSVKLADIPDGYQMDYRAAEYYNKMYNAALKEGIYLIPVSAYRTVSYQQQIFNETMGDYIYGYGMSAEEAEIKTATEVLYPGTSEHNLGFAVDIGSVNGYFEDSAAYAWLCENAHKYGFIERYTEDKSEITGIIPEPWHWRFVGVKYADKIRKSGLCLEEYLEKYNLIP